MNTFYNIAKTTGTDKVTVHSYHTAYDKMLESYRNKDITLLEIGIYNGASLKLWEQYFTLANIVGIDCDTKCAQYSNGRTSVHIGSQNDPDFLKTVAESSNGFDIIIDDGSHIMEHQLMSFKTLWPFIKSNGLYVIEDLHTSYIPIFGGSVNGSGSTIEYLKSLIDSVNGRGIYSNIQSIYFEKNIVFIQRGTK